MKTLFAFIGKKDSKEDQEFHSHNEITQAIEDSKELGVSKQTQAQNKKNSRAELSTICWFYLIIKDNPWNDLIQFGTSSGRWNDLQSYFLYHLFK